jgi:hypothetical protein
MGLYLGTFGLFFTLFLLFIRWVPMIAIAEVKMVLPGWIVLVLGLTGFIGGFAMMTWMNGIDYPLIIGGKPGFSPPSMIPILFECTVLLSGFGAVFGMFGLNQLPRHHHPIFESDRFESATDDRFFISIEAADPKFKGDETKRFLESLHPEHVELVLEGDES